MSPNGFRRIALAHALLPEPPEPVSQEPSAPEKRSEMPDLWLEAARFWSQEPRAEND